jgi:hypothetical protein
MSAIQSNIRRLCCAALAAALGLSVGGMQGFLGLRGYGDFDVANRAPGWSTWLTFSISPAAPTAEAQPTKHLVTK